MTNDELRDKFLELDERVTRHTEQIKSCFNQISELKALAESVNKLATSVQVIAHEQTDIKENMGSLVKSVSEIKELPARRWETVATVALTALISGVVGYILSMALQSPM